jgi:hypothetical protein
LTHIPYTKTASGRNAKPQPYAADSRPLVGDGLGQVDQFTAGGRYVHRRTRRCVAYCNTVAALAGIGPETR